MQKKKIDVLYNIAKGPKYDLIAEWIGKNKKVLDVGCGAGEFSKRLSIDGNEIIGVESSKNNYRIASKKIKVYFGEFSKIEINDKFDIVLFADVLEHMTNPEIALKKASTICNEVILSVPNFDFLGAQLLRSIGLRKMRSGILDENHIYFFNKEIIEKMINACNFEILNYCSPAPKKLPGFYNQIIKINPEIFGYQFIYKCKTKKNHPL